MHLVIVKSPEDISKLLKIKTIASFRIKWKAYRSSRKITQCFQCQEYGHGITNCHNLPRCVKCSVPHLTKNCTNPSSNPVIYTNCQRPHLATYRLCPKYIEDSSKVEQQRSQRKKNIISDNTNNKSTKQFVLQQHQFPLPQKMSASTYSNLTIQQHCP